MSERIDQRAQLVMVSGPSGAGRSSAINALEDLGFEAIDNMPLSLIPRLLDSFNGFLTDIDPAAFEKRGILDIVRDELATRAVFVLGKEAFTDVLITEFRIQ